jgi:serine/threonine-protein kinase
VIAAFPGSDPLAAALAAGETPLPEMVADAGSHEGLRPAVAMACLALILLGLAVHPFLAEQTSMTRAVGLELPPAALQVEARRILEEAGHTERPLDTEQGLFIDYGYLLHERGQAAEKRWKDVGVVRPAPVTYWYRQSPRYLTPTSFANGGVFRLRATNPPFDIPGMATVYLDAGGRLAGLLVMPPEVDDSEGPGLEPDWSLLFDRAGIDMATFAAARPKWNPTFDCDLRRAWEGTYPDQPDVPVRVEAGTWRGRPIYFQVIPHWHRSWRMESIAVAAESPGQKAATIVGFGLTLVTLAGGLMLARRNLRLGRGDRQSAFRLALIVLLSTMGGWVLGGHHEPTFAEVGLFFQALAMASFTGGAAYTVYIAIEPHVRRLWPNLMISWSRLFQGRFRDPLIGRDILIGAVAGTATFVLLDFGNLLPEWLGLPLANRGYEDVESLSGVRQVLARCASLPMMSSIGPIMMLLLLLLVRTILRKQWAAVSVLVLLFGAGKLASASNFVIDGSIGVIVLGLSFFVLLRHGLLASITMSLFMVLPRFGVWTTDLSSWYAGQMMIPLLLLAAIAVYAFYISLAGRPLFSAKLFDEDGAKV